MLFYSHGLIELHMCCECPKSHSQLSADKCLTEMGFGGGGGGGVGLMAAAQARVKEHFMYLDRFIIHYALRWVV